MLNRAFSTVVADNQYASLGLMLMGCLARLNKLISMPREREEEEEADKVDQAENTASRNMFRGEDLGEEVSREEMVKSVSKDTESLTTLKKGKRNVDTSSFGKALAVTEAGSISKGEEALKTVEMTASTTTSSKTATLKPPKKKRKKGGDEFDELFSSLI